MNGPMRLSEVYIGTVDPGYSSEAWATSTPTAKPTSCVPHTRGGTGDVWAWLMNGHERRSPRPWVATVPDVCYRSRAWPFHGGRQGGPGLVAHATSGEVWVWTDETAPRARRRRGVATVPGIPRTNRRDEPTHMTGRRQGGTCSGATVVERPKCGCGLMNGHDEPLRRRGCPRVPDTGIGLSDRRPLLARCRGRVAMTLRHLAHNRAPADAWAFTVAGSAGRGAQLGPGRPRRRPPAAFVCGQPVMTSPAS